MKGAPLAMYLNCFVPSAFSPLCIARIAQLDCWSDND